MAKKVADYGAGDAFPGQEPQATSDREQLQSDYSMQAPNAEPDEYNWSMSGTHVSVSDSEHSVQFDAMAWNDFTRPHAYGTLQLLNNWDALWTVTYTNMSMPMIETRLKRYTRDQGWEFAGLLDKDGEKLESQALKTAAAPGTQPQNLEIKVNPPYQSRPDHWYVSAHLDGKQVGELVIRQWPDYGHGPTHSISDVFVDPRVRRQGIASAMLEQARAEIGPIRHSSPSGLTEDGSAWADRVGAVPGIGEINPGLKDWKNNEWAGTEQYDNPAEHQSDTPFYGFQDPEEDMPDDQSRVCSECGELCIDYDDWRVHVLRDHVNTDRKPPADPQPVVDLDDVLPAHFDQSTMDKTVQRQSRLIHQLTAAGAPIPPIGGPIPFMYDIEQDRIFVGQPGQRHSDIQGRFTPGGVIEGLYDPKGNVQVRTDTDMPYTVRHMAQLWYAMHPELQIKAIYLMVGQKKFKLASAGIGHTVRNLTATDPAAWAAYQALEPLGNVYAVGGVVRDVVLGKTPKDVDLMVQGVEPEDVQAALSALPGRVDLTGKQFGVYRYRDREGNEVEVALPRTERSTGGGHKDFEVVTNPYISVGEDLARRDFTGNAMAVNLATGDLVDPYHGSEDLKSGVLRTVSDRSFPEDPLRILRAFSQISRHGLDPAPETYHDLAAHAHSLSELPQERLQMELDKMMSGDDPAKAVDLMEASGVLPHVLPDVAATTGFDQKSKYHAYPLSEHLKEVLRHVASETKDLDVRWAALLHDIGKPGSQWIDDQGYGHFYKAEDGRGADHEELGGDMAKRLLTDLKFPNDRIARIEHLIRHHMFPAFNSTAGARKFVNRVGDQHADDLLTLRNGDSGGKGLPHDGNVPLMRQYVQAVRDAGEPTSQSMLAINGNDLIQAGMKPGPEMGAVLKRLTDAVVEDPSLNTREHLLALAFQENPDLRTANILDPIHDGLDPDVFNHPDAVDPDLKPKIAEWVKNKVYKTLTDAGWPDPSKWLSLVLTGSLCTYQWGPESDFDISLWVDVKELPEYVRADLIALMIEKVDGTIVPGTTHVMQDFVVDVNKFKPEDLYQPGLRSAYDIDKMEWIVFPEKGRSQDVYKAYPAIINYAKMVEDKMRMMLRYDKAAVGIYWDFLHGQRHKDMMAGKGDYTESNIVYKWLANHGLFPYISEATGKYIA